MIKLREWHFPSPYGRNGMGEKDQLEKMTLESAKADWGHRYRAKDAILALAGNIEFEQAKNLVERTFGDWPTGDTLPITETPPPGNYRYEPQQSEQTHIGIAYPSLPETSSEYYTLRLAIEILSGGMSGGLFTAIRGEGAVG